ncbi:MAG TPA: hypothetical protein VLA04_05540 [Verrucomicrobiae bacterium]|nr:hypothetical protein [Verrucomicrobiae bacterium]
MDAQSQPTQAGQHWGRNLYLFLLIVILHLLNLAFVTVAYKLFAYPGSFFASLFAIGALKELCERIPGSEWLLRSFYLVMGSTALYSLWSWVA